MVRLGALLLLASVASAGDTVKDAYWGYEFKLPGLRRVLALGDRSLLFRGKGAGLIVSIRLHESDKQAPVARWLADAKAKKRKGATPPVVNGHWLYYRKKGLIGLDEFHGHAFFPRGYQCFEVHAVADDLATLTPAMTALVPAAEARGTLIVSWIARETKRPVNNPEVLLRAGIEYVTGKSYRIKSAGLARLVFDQARGLMQDALTKNPYKPAQQWMVFEYGGMARIGEPAAAIEWHRLAEKVADTPERRRQSAYNLACVCSLAKQIDDAFSALYRAYADGKPVADGHVSQDRDLENCRRDDRWHAFWRDKVRG